MSTTVNITKKFVDKRYYERNQDLGIIAASQSNAGAVDYTKLMLKNTEKTAYELDLPFYDINGNKLFEYDTANNLLKVQGNISATGEIKAYSNTDELPSLWDSMPVATATTLGGVKVDAATSDVYLDANNVLQITIPSDAGQWNNVTGGIEYPGGNVGITSGSLTVSNNVTITGNLTVNGTQFISNTETVQIADNLAIINYGETGSGVTAGFAGWEADRGTLANYKWGYDETRDLWVLGQVGDTLQAVATREDSPISNGLAKWNATANRFDTITNNSTNWDAAYTHSQDNSQAHSDYLINNGNDTTSGILTAAAFLANGQIGTRAAALQVNGFMRTGNILLHEGGDTPIGASAGTLSNTSGTLNWNGKLTVDSYLGSSDNTLIVHTSAAGNIYFRPNGSGSATGQMRLYSSGNLDVTGNVTADGEIEAYDTSDKRLKQNINPLLNATDLIEKMNPVSFNWNDKAKELNPNKDDRNNFGLIAQELEEIAPELIHSIHKEYKAIDYTQIISILIQSNKELTERIRSLEEKTI